MARVLVAGVMVVRQTGKGGGTGRPRLEHDQTSVSSAEIGDTGNENAPG